MRSVRVSVRIEVEIWRAKCVADYNKTANVSLSLSPFFNFYKYINKCASHWRAVAHLVSRRVHSQSQQKKKRDTTNWKITQKWRNHKTDAKATNANGKAAVLAPAVNVVIWLCVEQSASSVTPLATEPAVTGNKMSLGSEWTWQVDPLEKGGLSINRWGLFVVHCPRLELRVSLGMLHYHDYALVWWYSHSPAAKR